MWQEMPFSAFHCLSMAFPAAGEASFNHAFSLRYRQRKASFAFLCLSLAGDFEGV
jgi:hypothetical protein